MNYLRVNVYGHSSDCSNNGVTLVNKNKLVVPCENGNITETDLQEFGYTVLTLVNRVICRDNFIPLNDSRHLMFGGNFVWTSDSRFYKNYGSNPIPVHDRYEG